MPAASAISCVVACNLPSAKKMRFAVSLISFSVPVSLTAICLTKLSNVFEIKNLFSKKSNLTFSNLNQIKFLSYPAKKDWGSLGFQIETLAPYRNGAHQ